MTDRLTSKLTALDNDGRIVAGYVLRDLSEILDEVEFDDVQRSGPTGISGEQLDLICDGRIVGFAGLNNDDPSSPRLVIGPKNG